MTEGNNASMSSGKSVDLLEVLKNQKAIKEKVEATHTAITKLSKHEIYAMVSDGIWLYKIKMIIKAIPIVLILMGLSFAAGWIMAGGKI